MVIQINIRNKIARMVGETRIVCGNADYIINFSFDAEWTIPIKTARFVYVTEGRVEHIDVVFDGTTVSVPAIVDVKEVRVGVFAGELYTTTPAVIPCDRSIRCGTGAPVDPTPSQYDQIMELINSSGGVAGKDGVSPVVEVIETEKGHRVVITDAAGEHSFEVEDGNVDTLIVDPDFDAMSENPVQNKVISNKIIEIESTVGNVEILLKTI